MLSDDLKPSHGIQKTRDPSQGFTTHPLAEELVEWLTQNGGSLSHDVHIVHSKSQGFHVRAVSPLKSPIVASCPLKLSLSILNLDPEQRDVLHIESALHKCKDQIHDQVLPYLLLIEQYLKGKDSPWHPYIACLPGAESMSTALWFTDEDETFLNGTNLVPVICERKTALHEQWRHALNVMGDLNLALARDVTFELLLWAATIFTSRAFISTHILPGQKTIGLLFPVVDILNHSPSAKVEWDFVPHKSFTLRCLESDRVQAGDQLFNNYAPKQNGELLLGYGFCVEDNPTEQFALNIKFLPMIQEHAKKLGLLKLENVPFGMATGFLDPRSEAEQHFLRTKGHIFGQYENTVAFFRGIPPSIVHPFFIQTVLTLELDIDDIDVKHPDVRITLQVLVLLHRAIEQRCQSLPLHVEQEPKNDKQKFAKMYRDGQAKIIHSIRQELQEEIDKLREGPRALSKDSSNTKKLLQEPVLLDFASALSVLDTEYPSTAQTLRHGLTKHCFDTPEHSSTAWAALLIVFVGSMLTTPPAAPTSTGCLWLRTLFSRHPIPRIEDGIEDIDTCTFLDENLSDFLKLDSASQACTNGATLSPIDILDDFGQAYTASASEETQWIITGPMESLGVRLIMWTMTIVDKEVVPVWEEGNELRCLYLKPWIASNTETDGM